LGGSGARKWGVADFGTDRRRDDSYTAAHTMRAVTQWVRGYYFAVFSPETIAIIASEKLPLPRAGGRCKCATSSHRSGPLRDRNHGKYGLFPGYKLYRETPQPNGIGVYDCECRVREQHCGCRRRGTK